MQKVTKNWWINGFRNQLVWNFYHFSEVFCYKQRGEAPENETSVSTCKFYFIDKIK